MMLESALTCLKQYSHTSVEAVRIVDKNLDTIETFMREAGFLKHANLRELDLLEGAEGVRRLADTEAEKKIGDGDS